jgi:hypothetical protein
MSADEQVEHILDRDGIIEKKEEVDRIRQACLKRMEILAQESELLANKLKKLEEEDKHWDAELDHLQDANVPILCLPHEITSLIFEMARGQSKFDDDDPVLKDGEVSRPEIRVSHVCKDWRQVAISCPTLWSHIIISNWIAGRTVRPAQRLSTYLTRSQGVPLDIVVTIDTPAHKDIDCTDSLREFLLTVVPHSARWQRLVVWINGMCNTNPLSNLAKIVVPQLEIFEIGSWPLWRVYCDDTHYPPEMPNFVTLFQVGAPKLTYAFTSSEILLPSHSRNLSTVHIHSNMRRRPWEQFTALVSLPNLRNLTLDGPIFEAPNSPTTATRVVVRNLRHFRLGCPVVSHYLWDTIAAPELVLLMLFEMVEPRVASMDNIFPRSFFPSLKTIAFWNVDTQRPEDLLHIAMATSHVTNLIICDCEADSVLMSSLYQHSFTKNPQLWPQLQTLTYVVTHPKLCFANRKPKTYKEARKILLQLVDWRLETFACKCTLIVEMTHLYRDGVHEFCGLPHHVPLYDGRDKEYQRWRRLSLPRDHGRLIPWPEIIGAGYYAQLKFDNERMLDLDDDL